MKPLEDIASWINQQNPTVQEQLASAVLPFLGFPAEEIASRLASRVALLDEWLTAPQQISARICRILTLRTLVDFCVGERFAGDGWASVEELHTAILVDPRARQITREMAETFLADLPALKVEWVRAGESWRVLLATSLSDLSLKLAITIDDVSHTAPAPSGRQWSDSGRQAMDADSRAHLI